MLPWNNFGVCVAASNSARECFLASSFRKSSVETRDPPVSPAGQRLAGLRADPHLAPLKNLLLPDRHGFLDFLNREAAGLKGVVAVRGGDCDHDARFGNLHGTDAVDDRHPLDAP